MKHILLLLPTTSYRNSDFLAAAEALNVEIISAADYCHQLAPQWGLTPIMSVHFDMPEQAAETILRALARKPEAVLAVDDHGLELAALLNERLGLKGNQPQAVRKLRDKLAFRELLSAHGFNCPEFHHLPDHTDPAALIPRFPAVVKARRLSASRGVIRADNLQQYLQATARAREIQSKADRDAAVLGLVALQSKGPTPISGTPDVAQLLVADNLELAENLPVLEAADLSDADLEVVSQLEQLEVGE